MSGCVTLRRRCLRALRRRLPFEVTPGEQTAVTGVVERGRAGRDRRRRGAAARGCETAAEAGAPADDETAVVSAPADDETAVIGALPEAETVVAAEAPPADVADASAARRVLTPPAGPSSVIRAAVHSRREAP